MERKKKDSKTGFPGFMKYRENNLTGREKNAFEKELQKDPFALEADEGLSSLQGDSMIEDMDILSKRLKRRTQGNRRIIIYRIAASVAVLMAVSSLFFLLRKSEEVKPSNNPGAIEISRAEPIKAAKDDEVSKGKTVQINQDKANKIRAGQAAPKGQIAENNLRKITRDTINKEEKVTAPELITADNLSNISPAPPLARALTENPGLREIRGKVISAEDQMPIAGASVLIKGTKTGTVSDANGDFKLTVPEKPEASLVASFIGMEEKEVPVTKDSILKVSLSPSSLALSEVVVTGYGTRRALKRDITGAAVKVEAYKEEASIGYTYPEPVNGKGNFDDYIETNIRKPNILKAGEKAVVVLSFIVRNNGTPDSIRVIRSPGQPYSDEAVRLIKEGPKWKPATENGNPVEEEARVRIVFK